MLLPGTVVRLPGRASALLSEGSAGGPPALLPGVSPTSAWLDELAVMLVVAGSSKRPAVLLLAAAASASRLAELL